MADFQPRALHLHTLDSLIADLVSGRAISLGDDKEFTLADDRTRSALQWYREQGVAKWSANVGNPQVETLVNAILKEPLEVAALPARAANANTRWLTLKKLVAHRFGGLHKFGTPEVPPENYVHEFSKSITLFEGRNGSGKTSLVNAIIWALTGEILRPQREPEKANVEFECFVDAVDGNIPTAHKQTPVTPMIDVDDFQLNQSWVPADTWVELTFEDEKGILLPPIRRSQSRTSSGRLEETPPDLSILAVDPIAIRIGTVMPGLLPLIKVGLESELGRAVSQLTGLSSLVDLSDHVRRAKQKIDKELVKQKTDVRSGIDGNYSMFKSDLEKELKTRPEIAPNITIPAASNDKSIEETLDKILEHFETAKATAFKSAQNILGDGFDPADIPSRENLEKNIAPALNEIDHVFRLLSFVRLRGLNQLTSEQLDAATLKIATIVNEAKTLTELAKNPSKAARARLYARIATWISDHPEPGHNDGMCVVCGGSIAIAVDPVTGKLVSAHLHDAKADAVLLSQTFARWSEATLGDLARSLPGALHAELAADLPAHPCDLLRKAIVDELFELAPFAGVLQGIKTETAQAFDAAVAERSELPKGSDIELPPNCDELKTALQRLDLALRFAQWRQANDALARVIIEQVLGRRPKDGEAAEKITLTGKLLDLEATVKAAKPLNDALTLCGRLQEQIKFRRAVEIRLAEYTVASNALKNLLMLGELADMQVEHLRQKLSKKAAYWRNEIYLGAFPGTAHELLDTPMGRKGQLDITVRAGGVSAPAQHVTNASALRASLVAFYLAFWEHVLNERGGLKVIILDDPQELLDDENRERLAEAFGFLAKTGGQVILTSNDPRFSKLVARTKVADGVEHLEVHPATKLHPTVRTTPPRVDVIAKRKLFDADSNAEAPAQDYTSACRVFLEGKLGDLFDDSAFSSWVKKNPMPTLADFVGRLRRELKSAGPQSMFGAPLFKTFVDHPALADNSDVLKLMNKSHHGDQQDIRASDVARCADDLDQLTTLAEDMYEECCRWRRRDKPPENIVAAPDFPADLVPISVPKLNVIVCPDLAAFTQHSPSGASQDIVEPLDPALLDNKAIYFLRRNNFGFAAPKGALAIVEAESGTGKDRRLVVARNGKATYARRLVRSHDSDIIGLTADIPDQRIWGAKTILIPESEVAIHQVMGILFDHNIKVDHGLDEAVQVDAGRVFDQVEVAFRVVDESAVPLALPNQVVLGGPQIGLADLGQHEGRLVALTLDDGSSIFKRVGAVLPDELAHLRQFESIGGLGLSQIFSVGKQQSGVQVVQFARLIIGVLYHS